MSRPESACPLSMVIVGASGDLARRKIFPALFALYCQELLPADFHVFGFARSEMDDRQFRARITEHLTCRYSPGPSCAQRMDEFLARCRYVCGDYGSSDSFLDLYQAMREAERGRAARRFYYLAIPPSVFLDAVHAIGGAGLVRCGTDEPWSRVVVEEQTYRIDHYLGKEVIQNLLVLRFANTVLEPLWNRDFIQSVHIVWKEDIGLEGRGGYFDRYGIIRDVMQNHLLQILALVAMEPPARLDPAHIAAEKVAVVRRIPPLELDDVVIGQYQGGLHNGRHYRSYVEDPGVPDDSLTPTFAAARVRIQAPRWDGVPFLISAGKGLDARATEIRIRFREVARDMFCDLDRCPEANELLIRVQPDEAIQLSLTNKVPGMGMVLQARNLDLQYKQAFTEPIPDAYESLLLDVVRGDRSLFIQRRELQAAWDVFTPVLHELHQRGVVPEPYAFGSRGPERATRWMP